MEYQARIHVLASFFIGISTESNPEGIPKESFDQIVYGNALDHLSNLTPDDIEVVIDQYHIEDVVCLGEGEEPKAKRLPSVETGKVQLEVIECVCGYHMGIDATFLEQVKDFTTVCPSCGAGIKTAEIIPE